MVDGIAQLTKKLTKDVPGSVKRMTRRAMEQGADELVAMMRRLVPVEEGDLRDSIGWTWGAAPAGAMIIGTVQGRGYKTMRITIYAGNEKTIVTNERGIQFQNARLQEFGTQAMEANPFFFVSWRALKKRIRSRIKREVKYAVESHEGGLVRTDE